MKQKGVNDLSLTTHYLRMIPYGSSATMATGTGFVYEYGEKYYLITNGHNVTRVNPETNQRIEGFNSAAFPIKIATKVKIQRDENYHIVSDLIGIDLYQDSWYKEARWLVHPRHKYNVDVVAIPIDESSNIPRHVKLFPINKLLFDSQFDIEIGDDVFILGYPFDIVGGKELPIWKRGTISTEPLVDVDNLPKLLVDTATRAGMSGSPVIMYRRGFHSLHEGDGLKGDELVGTIRTFVGIYSGRIGAHDNFLSQLGIVWKNHVIDEILEGQMLGDIEFQNK